jgi:hypothetical protein
MLFKFVFFFFIFTNFVLSNDEHCGNFTCVHGRGKCFKNGTEYDCVCNEFFATFPENNTLKCNYERKKQSVAFILETLVTYGAGHFYCENYQFAVPKMFFWILSYCLFIFLRNIIKSGEEQNTTVFIISLVACLFLTIMFAWQLADMVLYGLNIYMDGNNIELLPWGVSGINRKDEQ